MAKDKQKKSSPLFDILNSINFTKEDIIKVDPLNYKSDYTPFIINRFLSYHIDCILYTNEMNIRHAIRPDMQYYYYLHSIRKKKRFAKFQKSEEKDLDKLNIIKEYYKCSNTKAKAFLQILSNEQLDIIKSKLYKGGIGK